MAEETNPATIIRQWMAGVIDQGISARQWAIDAGLSPSTVQRAMKPTYKFVTSSKTLAKLAAVVGQDPPEIRKAREAQIVPRFLEVRYKVQAGNWIEMDNDVQQFNRPPHPVASNPAFDAWPQWLEEVVGDSIDEKIPPGGLAHIVDAIDMGYSPRDGDFVVVERRRAGGLLRERTIKQVVMNGGTVELWPRSRNPKWSGPVILGAGNRPNEDMEVEVVGLVLGFYASMR